MNRIVKWLRKVLQVDQLENEFFDHEKIQGEEMAAIRSDLLAIKRKLRALEIKPCAIHQHQTFHADGKLRSTVDCLCADLEEVKTTLSKQGRRNGTRPKRPKS